MNKPDKKGLSSWVLQSSLCWLVGWLAGLGEGSKIQTKNKKKKFLKYVSW